MISLDILMKLSDLWLSLLEISQVLLLNELISITHFNIIKINATEIS